MLEVVGPIVLLVLVAIVSIWYIHQFKRYQINTSLDRNSFWNNAYIFESLPSIFPTLGILCTALGITVGIWNFNTDDIQSSIPQLLNGLRLAFVATMLGIVGLLVFQKYTAIIQKQIDDSPTKPVKHTDELAALNKLSASLEELKNSNQQYFDSLIANLGIELENKVGVKIASLEKELSSLKAITSQNEQTTTRNLKDLQAVMEKSPSGIVQGIEKLQVQQNTQAEKANQSTQQIIKGMGENNQLISRKFDEFSELLRKNNTDALVLVMKTATEQFNAQMTELISRLVQENFQELNTSVQSLNTWQKENKQQVQQLTDYFQKTTESFATTSQILSKVAAETQTLVDADGKLGRIIAELQKVMINDGKFQEIINKVSSTVDTLNFTTEAFEETTSKLNDWIKTERNFKQAAEVLIVKLEEFKDMNGDVWNKYRREMQSAVNIIKETSTQLNEDLDKINAEFYDRLSETLSSLDECIQRFVPTNNQRR